MTVNYYHLGVIRLPASFSRLAADTPLCALSLLSKPNTIDQHFLHGDRKYPSPNEDLGLQISRGRLLQIPLVSSSKWVKL
ncbi:uncharacterized [Tachysurus ichikawai]